MDTIKKLTWRQLIEDIKKVPEDQLDEPVIGEGDEEARRFTSLTAWDEDLRQTDEGWESASTVEEYQRQDYESEEDFEAEHPIVFKKGWVSLNMI